MPETVSVDPSPLGEILARFPPDETSLIQVLQDVHRVYNYLPAPVLAKVGMSLGVPIAKVYSVATFYRAFSLEPQGRTIVRVCLGTACHIRGAGQLLEELSRELKIGAGETTPDQSFTIKTVNCVGACAMAPVLIVGEKYHGKAKPAQVSRYLPQSKGNDDDAD